MLLLMTTRLYRVLSSMFRLLASVQLSSPPFPDVVWQTCSEEGWLWVLQLMTRLSSPQFPAHPCCIGATPPTQKKHTISLFPAAVGLPRPGGVRVFLFFCPACSPHSLLQWGNPAQKEYYEYMRSYSPVDNLRAEAYPNILVTAGLHDPRVGEPACCLCVVCFLVTICHNDALRLGATWQRGGRAGHKTWV